MTESQEPLRVLHIDMDAFFASVELLRRPELSGRPVVVGGRGDPTRRGVVSTATYEARQFGIHSAMPLRTAARLCPEAVFLPVDFDAYREASRRVFAIVGALSPVVERVGLDEAYVDLATLAGDPVARAWRLKADIVERTRLVASIGLAPNRLLAKIASDLEKPDGLTVLRRADVPDRVWPLSVRKLHGVGPRTGERLAALGIHTVGELAAADPAALGEVFSERHCNALRRAAHGEDDRTVSRHRPRKSIGRETTFQQDCRSTGKLAWHADAMLLDELVPRLAERGIAARTVTIKLRYRDFVTNTRSVSLPQATADATLLREAARTALFSHTLHRAVRLLGVQLSNLASIDEANHTDRSG